MTAIVPPCGPTNSPLLALVGEAPGQEEERQLTPFVGPSGFLLNQMLSQAGIAREDCYITNVSLTRPPDNDFGKAFYEDSKRESPTRALCDCRERLWTEMRTVKPKVIVAFGAEPMKALTHKGGITNYRGTMVEFMGLRVVPTFHPSYILRGNYSERSVVEADLRKAHRQAKNPYKPTTCFNADPTFSEVIDFFNTPQKRYTLDIETIKNIVRCIGFGWSKTEALSIPFITRGVHHWTEDQEREILHRLDLLFRDPSIEFELQNGPYDITILAREFGFVIANYAFDNMFAHHLLFPELLKGLDFQCSVYTDHHMYWDYERGNDKDTRTYNCYDCVVTWEAGEEIKSQLVERNQMEFYKSIIQRVVPALTRVQSRGVLIDEKARLEIKVETEKEIEQCKVKLAALLGYELNPNSTKQVPELVYNKWKLPRQFKRGQTNATCDEDALKALIKKCREQSQVEILKTIILARQKRVLLSTFVEMPLKDGRTYTSYNPAGTVTGRLSSSSTFDGFGGNLQNIPRGSFRRIYRADPGKVLIRADLSQAEYRVLIWKAKIRRVIDRLLDPKFSIHMWNAAENIYRVPYDQVTKKMYDESKNGVYGANYGIGPHKVSRMYDIEFQQAKFIIQRYHQAVPEIEQVYQRGIRETVIATRKLINPLGRERTFLGRMDDDLFRAAYSHFCQSTVADVISSALIELDDWEVQTQLQQLTRPAPEILLQVHDELISQVWEKDVEEGVRIVRKAMERPIVVDSDLPPLTIPCGIKVGYDWFNTKPLDEWLKEKQCPPAQPSQSQALVGNPPSVIPAQSQV